MELLSKIPRKEGMRDETSFVKLVRAYWDIEERQKALTAMDPAYGISATSLASMDLKTNDGQQWDWVWNDPLL